MNAVIQGQDGFFDNSASKYVQHDMRTNIDFKLVFRCEEKFYHSFPEELNFVDVNQQYANGSNPKMNRWPSFSGRVNFT